MQSYSLTVDKFLDHAAKWWGGHEIVQADKGRVAARTTYALLRTRSNRLSGALASLGMAFGDRIGTLAWNTQHHLEVYYGAMGVGLVCHTLNPRLTAVHLAAMINEAEDHVLAVASNLMPLLAELVPLCPVLKHIILLDGGAPQALHQSGVQVWAYEALLETRGAAVSWGAFDEETPAGLCYTSGTTGSPKGVLYTHRSNYLHTLRALQADAMGLTGSDVLLVAVPMFHANGWGMPFVAPAVGAKLVLPSRYTDGASLVRLMQSEGVTLAAGIHTVWQGVADYLDATGEDVPALKRLIIGGTHCPDALLQRLEKRLGARVQNSWGMTELSPTGTIEPPQASSGAVRSVGRPPLGMDMKLTDADGVTLAQQRGVVGHLWVKGASVVDHYFKTEASALDAEGYFNTGDLASINEDGNLTICGRSKDLIKSGGEWINPAEIEDLVGRDPAIAQVAVIGQVDAKWGERPVLIVELQKGKDLDAQSLIGLLRGKVADWWLPDRIVRLSAMPLAATGKIDKARLRADCADGKLQIERVSR